MSQTELVPNQRAYMSELGTKVVTCLLLCELTQIDGNDCLYLMQSVPSLMQDQGSPDCTDPVLPSGRYIHTNSLSVFIIL